MTKHFILLVEDHIELALTLSEYLEQHQFVVDYVRNIESAKSLIEKNIYQLFLFDINLPDGSGFELCQWLRNDQCNDTPVIMLTARDTLEDKICGFDHGTDDYLVKPFDFKELVARANALIKRASGDVSKHILQIEDLTLDSSTQTVFRAGHSLELPPIQFKLLKILMRQSPKIVTKQEMIMAVWGDEEPESDALRSHIYNLRKLVDKPFEKKLIHTISGVGLKMIPEQSHES